MAQVKADFTSLTKTEKLARAAAIHTASTGNPNFPPPQPILTALETAKDEANGTTGNVAALRAQLDSAEESDTAAFAALDDAVADWATSVQSQTNGDPVKIASSGFGVRSTDNTPLAMTQPQDVNATAGDEPGEVDLACEPVKGVRVYEVEATTDLTGATGWHNVLTRSRSRLPVKGLISGTKYAFRIRAIGGGEDNTGPWSNVVQKMAP